MPCSFFFFSRRGDYLLFRAFNAMLESSEQCRFLANDLRKRLAGEFEVSLPSNVFESGISDDAGVVVWLEKRDGTGAGI